MNVIAVDVGTTSVRLAIISFGGPKFNEVKILASREREISHHQDGPRFEQSSREIWKAICACCISCVDRIGINESQIHGIAFSATCSLVLHEGDSLEPVNDVIMWMDHRAIDEAQEITDSGSKVLEQFGGTCSPEFSLAKLVWLQKNCPERLDRAKGIFELPDWLVYQCVRGEASECPQSLCCAICKWGYDIESNGHCGLVDETLGKKTPKTVLEPGTISGFICQEAAIELGLIQKDRAGKENTDLLATQKLKIVVGTSLIDAHSGMLAMLSVPLTHLGGTFAINSTFCSLAGTSTCNMTLSKGPNFTKGIWGPYKNVVLDNYYLLEAGQSMTGKLIDMSIERHSEGKQRLLSGHSIKSIIEALNGQLEDDQTGRTNVEGLFVLPTFHGNRSPLANPRLKGGVYGLTSEHEASLLEIYVATVESIVFETKLIVETLGIRLETILVSGGLMKNDYYMQTLADVLRCQVVRMSLDSVDFMVMGSGIVARHAVMNQLQTKTVNVDSAVARDNPLTETSIDGLQYCQLDNKIFRSRDAKFAYHDKRYLCYKEFVKFSQRVDDILSPK